MKRKNLVCAACFTMAVIYANAQTKNTIAPPPPPTAPMALLAPPPPPPPIPPVPPVPPTPPSAIEDIAFPIPPPPPIPPVPPYDNMKGIAIINSNGYDISITRINGTSVVVVKKDTKTQKIKLIN